MDWIEFDDCFLKLRRILRDFIGDGKSLGKSDVYSNYIDYRGDIKQIVHRIETEVNEYTEINRKVIEMIKKERIRRKLNQHETGVRATTTDRHQVILHLYKDLLGHISKNCQIVFRRER